MISIIGNAPSSGSTFLADLLDSTKYSACGVELNLFSNTKFYDFGRFKKNIQCSSRSFSIHRIRNRINSHRLHSYALDNKELSQMVSSSQNTHEFVEKFTSSFLALRGKEEGGIVFEKTPENINCIGEFLNTFQDSYFIHIVRNPLYIYPSLLRRNFPSYIALTSWLIDVAKYIKYKDHPRAILVRYEDLITNPFKITQDILQKTANITGLSEDEIKKGYEHNRYRQIFSKKIKTWQVHRYGTIENANEQNLSRGTLMNLSRLLNAKVSPAYAQIFGITPISFLEAISQFGYYDDILAQLQNFRGHQKIPQKTLPAYLRLFLKWEEDFRHADASVSQLGIYLNPVTRS